MPDIKQIVRIANIDLDGNINTFFALSRVYGVSFSFANAVCNYLELDRLKPIGVYSDEEVRKIEEVIKNPVKHNFPVFMLNRRKDTDTGKDEHLLGSDLKLRNEFDVKRMKNIKSYKGIRHGLGLPVRGQSTRSHFHRGKSMGVKKPKSGKKG